jgi:hypothetical protein
VKTSFIFCLTPHPATQKDHDEGGGGKNGDHALMTARRQLASRCRRYRHVFLHSGFGICHSFGDSDFVIGLLRRANANGTISAVSLNPMLRISPHSPSAELLRVPNGVNPRTRQNLKNPKKFCLELFLNYREPHAKVFGILQILPGVDAIRKSDTMSRWRGRGDRRGAMQLRQLICEQVDD